MWMVSIIEEDTRWKRGVRLNITHLSAHLTRAHETGLIINLLTSMWQNNSYNFTDITNGSGTLTDSARVDQTSLRAAT